MDVTTASAVAYTWWEVLYTGKTPSGELVGTDDEDQHSRTAWSLDLAVLFDCLGGRGHCYCKFPLLRMQLDVVDANTKFCS